MDNKKATALSTSVGADEGQSTPVKTNQSIRENVKEINDDFETERMQELCKRLNNPDYLPTVSLTELYDTPYQPKSQIVGGLLSTGVYLFVGAPKDSGSDAQHFHSRNFPVSYYDPVISKYFKSISLVHKLQETRAFVGFSRIEPKEMSIAQRKEMLRLGDENWLPAIQVQVEGIFLNSTKM